MCTRGAPFCLRWMMTIAPPPINALFWLWFIKYKHDTSFWHSHKTDGSWFLRWNLDADFDSKHDWVQVNIWGLKLMMSHESIYIKETSKGCSTLVNPLIFRESWWAAQTLNVKNAKTGCGKSNGNWKENVENRNIFHFNNSVDTVCRLSSLFQGWLTCFVSTTVSKWPPKGWNYLTFCPLTQKYIQTHKIKFLLMIQTTHTHICAQAAKCLILN